jgi:hypothetical protein
MKSLRWSAGLPHRRRIVTIYLSYHFQQSGVEDISKLGDAIAEVVRASSTRPRSTKRYHGRGVDPRLSICLCTVPDLLMVYLAYGVCTQMATACALGSRILRTTIFYLQGFEFPSTRAWWGDIWTRRNLNAGIIEREWEFYLGSKGSRPSYEIVCWGDIG